MSELKGHRLSRDEMIAIVAGGGSVGYHGKRGNRIITRVQDLPSLAEMVDDGYITAARAKSDVDRQLAELERQKAQLEGGKTNDAPKGARAKGGE